MISRDMLVKGGRVLDPASGVDEPVDVRIRDGRVSEVRADLEVHESEIVIDVSGFLVTPGLVDVHVHFREPGQEWKETIATGAAAAVAGGFTTVCVMPNTRPVVDTVERVRFVKERGRAARLARILPLGAASVGSRGERLTDIGALASTGAVAVTDDGLPIATPELLGDALQAASEAGIVVADHCEDRRLSAGGTVSTEVGPRLGAAGIPPQAESDAVARDLDVLSHVGGRLHICHVSTSRSVSLLREAKASGMAVTAEATPHHLTLTAKSVESLGPAAKMNPPLASEADREALIEGLIDGTLDCVATDHAPHSEKEKRHGLENAPFGIVGLETAIGVLLTELVITGRVSLELLIERMTSGPARSFGLAAGRLAPGDSGDLSVIDLDEEWTVTPESFWSKARNTPWAGQRLRGRVVLTVVGGRVVYDRMSGGRGNIRREP